ncbi:dihydrodipicolinate reductase, partial [Morganella morganii]
MGRQLIQAIAQNDDVVLGAAFEREGSSLTGTDAGELAGTGRNGVILTADLNSQKDNFD